MSERAASEQTGSEQTGTAVVTGGGTGIGRAIARALAERGDRVVIVGRRPDRLESAAKDINAEVGGPPVLPFAADVTDPDQVERLAGFVTGEFGTLDVLVNNAGGTHPAPVTSLRDLAARHTTLYLQNVVSALLVTQALGPAIRRPGGRIIMISSRSARSAGGDPGYAATKAALNRIVVGLANDYGPDGVTVNAVAPGYVPDTELYSGAIPAEWHERIVAGISVGRGGAPAEIATVVRDLAAPGSSFVNGTVIEVDGGLRPST
ncbi:dehydrogenase of unknown specificity, short-chain alcohol dehydrogenase like [Frankia torreyi]|uniref:Ketoreductase domain-containing protein n=1 Tax=Frankia torreyi TaxID=1856 RepID=A0A0D8B8E3_9ACTN|nr:MULTISPECIES: SDR family oxidoreductase [Frankia]KJE20553.1 dehydrogenase of unknown specificity, short-chain alcohol dehydrogenase like [Frankia torreyi]KQC39559.1 3-oxoacyl-ACP reductase [Frankia sp. ACN1ag]KQM02882.1 dehydrogenase of unknown specificity, short-chain alcohol dehydrogenase like [Frankia sp. CpI1-P]